MISILSTLQVNLLAGLCCAAILSGCANVTRTDFPVTDAEQQANLPAGVNIIRLTPENIGNYSSRGRNWHPDPPLPIENATWRYLVGVGDVLSITVWEHPELTLPAGPERSQLESGSSVNENGEIFYPYIGQVSVRGKTVQDIQNELTTRLSEYIPDPQIEVKVAAFNSQKVNITGAVSKPTTLPITNIPLSLIEAINKAGGLDDGIDSRHVTVRRGGSTYYVNLRDFLENGRSGGNPTLRGGDVVNVPIFRDNTAFILGQVIEPGVVDLGEDGVTLTAALTERGGLNETTADAQGIFVFRESNITTGFDVFQLDATTPLAFVLATKFMLHPDDVVYIVTDPAAKWNELIADIAPSISAVRGVQVIGGGT